MSEMARHWSESVDWLWAPNWKETDHVARIVQFRRTFSLEEVPGECTVDVSADTRYRLFVNGKSVSFGPAKSHLREWNYETVDIAPLLQKGQNAIAARVLRYSPQHPGNMSMIRGIIPGFILHCPALHDVSTTSPSRWRCKVDEAVDIGLQTDWNPALGPSFLAVSETVDGTHQDVGWLEAGFDDSKWELAVKASMKAPMLPIMEPRRLVERSIPVFPEQPCMFASAAKADPATKDNMKAWNDLVTQDRPQTIPAHTKTSVVLQSEALTTGFLHFRVQDGAGARLRVRCAECFEPVPDPNSNGPFVRQKGIRSDTSGVLVGLDDVYTVSKHAAPDTEAVYEPFWFRTFRYVEIAIETAARPLHILQASYRTYHYPLVLSTQLDTSFSPEASALWTVSINTLRNCMHETYEDCPFYEQNQFAMDARLQILFTYELSHDDRLARKCMQEFYASRRADGLIETHFPAPLPVVNIPYFSLYWILMVHDHMRYRGDEALVRRYLGTVDGILEHFSQRVSAATGLVGRFGHDVWPFVDWTREWADAVGGDFRNMAVPPGYRRTGVLAYSSLLYAYVLARAADLCDFVQRSDTAAEYRRRARSLNAAVVKHCRRTDSGGVFLADAPDSPTNERSQHTQVFAVLSGALQGDEARAVLRRTIEGADRASFARCSYAMSFYVFEACRQLGHGDLYDALRPALLQPWRAMLAQNLTTWAESEAMPRSDCHAWGAVPIHDFVANMAGLTPAAAGYKAIRFAPRRQHWPAMKGTFVAGPGGEVALAWAPGAPVRLTPTFDTTVEVVGVDGTKTEHRARAGQTLTLDL